MRSVRKCYVKYIDNVKLTGFRQNSNLANSAATTRSLHTDHYREEIILIIRAKNFQYQFH